ncbi:MAG: HAD-IA family hydrolase [Notoacmeibacter sp.]|nr:HAD-IA family hydrolase [Notoacmeibacter sp.]
MADDTLAALIFDVDGTIAETEDAHRLAFNRAFADFGLGWVWSVPQYQTLLLTTGGKERIRAHAAAIGFDGRLDVDALHARKTEIYKEYILSGLARSRPGVEPLIRAAHAAGIALAIATTTSRANLDVLFENSFGAELRSWFHVTVCGEDVDRKKPDPAVYRIALEQLAIPARRAVAIEDSRAGVLAARGAGIENVLVTPSLYTGDHDFAGAKVILTNLASYFSYRETGSAFAPDALPAPMAALLRKCCG